MCVIESCVKVALVLILCYSSMCVKVALVLVLLTGVTRIVSIVVYKSLLRYRHNGEVKTMLKIVKTSYIVYT